MWRAAVPPVSRRPSVVLGKSTFERHFLKYEQAGLFLRESASLTA